MKKAIVLLSGGLDSTTVLAIAKNARFETYALSFAYGQRHKIELESANRIAKEFGAKEHKIAKYKSRFIMKVNDTIIADYANSKCGFINAKEMSIKAVKNMIKN